MNPPDPSAGEVRKRVVVAGGRDFRDFAHLCRVLDERYGGKLITVLSGGQCSTDRATGEKYGADYLGERWADLRGVPINTFDADWTAHKLAAGPIRNYEMARSCDEVVVFWDGKSRGTKSMIEAANQYYRPCHVVKYALSSLSPQTRSP